MKLLPFALSLLLASATISVAGTGQSPLGPKVITEPGIPSLYLKNVRVDPRDGRIRGTAYVNFGHTAPRAAHVHFYALSAAGDILAEGCDRLSSVSLSPHPRRAGKGRDAFSAFLGNLRDITTVRLVAHSGHGC
jgi:hypothetical protein